MALVELRVGPLPARVRLVRLVAAAVARRADLDPESLDEVRLAVAEACGLAIDAGRVRTADAAGPLSPEAHAGNGASPDAGGHPIAVDFDDTAGLVVTVHASGDVCDERLTTSASDPAPDRLAVLEGLLGDDVVVTTADGASSIRMAWGHPG